MLNSGRRILIYDATHSDAGSYKVEIASLDFHDSVCDSVWLPLLRNHAAHAPVTFTLKLTSESPSSQCKKSIYLIRSLILSASACYQNIGCADEHSYTENPSIQYYPLVNGDISTLMTISHDTNLSSSWTSSIISNALNDVSSTLSVNGSRLASDASKFNLSRTVMGLSILTEVINFLYNISDEGFYVHYQYLSNPYNLYRVLRDQGHRCRDHYHYADSYLSLYRGLSFVTFPFILITYSK